MERSRDWMNQAAHSSGFPGELYTEEEARRLISYAEKIINFCKDLLSRI